MWKLEKEWYGRRPAAQAWVEWLAGVITKEESMGFSRCKVAPWFFTSSRHDIDMEAHMDDLHGCGPEPRVREFLAFLESKVEMTWEIHKEGDTYSHLKRQRTILAHGTFIQWASRYSTDLETLSDGARAVSVAERGGLAQNRHA